MVSIDFGGVLAKIFPSIRQERKARNRIKSHYFSNIQSIESGEPVKLYSERCPHQLWDYIEKKHLSVESKIKNLGEKKAF